MKKSFLRFLAVLLLAALPVVFVGALGFAITDQFEKTFLGEFDNKVERLYAAEGEKIVIIGGSSVAFGVDAKLLSEQLGKPVINFGLYATLGTKTMLDYAKDAICEGDIIVIAPEMNAQTWSLYFNAEAMWQAVDGDFSLLSHIDSDDMPAMLGGFWKFAASKLGYAMQDGELDPEGIYNAASFDEYGFIRYRRDKDYNTMVGGVDASMVIDFDTAMISEDFVDYVNDYISYAESKGAKVYLSFCPMNESALPADISLETLETYMAYLRENFHCEILGDPNYMIYPSGYFYDSNFHLNSAGATVHTRQLAIDLAPLVGLTEADITIDYPEPPEIPTGSDEPEIYEYDENEVYFTYEMTDFGVYITGLSELGKAQETLTTPVAYDGKKVVSFKADTFAGAEALRELTITKNIGQIPDGTFRGASSLTKIHLEALDPNDTTVNNLSGIAMEGLPSSAKFYVSADSLSAYQTNYFWGPYAEFIVAE